MVLRDLYIVFKPGLNRATIGLDGAVIIQLVHNTCASISITAPQLLSRYNF